jgi:hypothetical protein
LQESALPAPRWLPAAGAVSGDGRIRGELESSDRTEET